ncbi:cation transporter [Micromonospora sp. SH-82]|uniref:cation transporter n=1 Tax=Micromonospora sp. SH-82 TaxID=3132938 RepID=UPI003EBFEF3C
MSRCQCQTARWPGGDDTGRVDGSASTSRVVPAAREKTALRVIAVSFFALAGYVTVESVRALAGGVEATHSTVGLALAALSLAVMPGLSYAQRRTGRELGSRSAVVESKQTLLRAYLSAVLLLGLAINSLFGWSWADPLAALVIAAVAVREGRDAWRGEQCCAPNVALTATRGDGGSAPGCTDGCCGISGPSSRPGSSG